MSAQLQAIYTEEEERGARLNYLLCDVATEMCYNVFHRTLGYPQDPADLFDHFRTPKIYCALQRLKKPRGRVITEEQWDLLFPHIPMLPNSQTFDITLWMIILRSICNLPPPSNGWDMDPNTNDNTLSANLVRLRLCRNRLRGHNVSTSLSKAEFNLYWQEVEDILVVLGCSKAEIDKRKTGSLDPKLVIRCKNLLIDLQKVEDVLDKEINTIKEVNVQLKTRQQEIDKEIHAIKESNIQLETRQQETDNEINAIKEDNVQLKTGQQEIDKEISAIKEYNIQLETRQQETDNEINAVKEDNVQLKTGQQEINKEIYAIKEDNVQLKAWQQEIEQKQKNQGSLLFKYLII